MDIQVTLSYRWVCCGQGVLLAAKGENIKIWGGRGILYLWEQYIKAQILITAAAKYCSKILPATSDTVRHLQIILWYCEECQLEAIHWLPLGDQTCPWASLPGNQYQMCAREQNDWLGILQLPLECVQMANATHFIERKNERSRQSVTFIDSLMLYFVTSFLHLSLSRLLYTNIYFETYKVIFLRHRFS